MRLIKKSGTYRFTFFTFEPMATSTVYLIPVPLFPQEIDSIPNSVREKAVQIKYYFVENVRTARRVLKLYDSSVVIDEIEFVEVNHKTELDTERFKRWLDAGYEIGIMSEAGLPAMADPGAQLVSIAHRHHAKVVPLTGPGSVYLALMGSGMNGQHFEFLGYLPIDNAEKIKAIKSIEEKARKNITQIFIETPYRNNQLLEQLIRMLPQDLDLCIALHLTAPDEKIQTQSIQQWKKQNINIHKIPCIFLVGKMV